MARLANFELKRGAPKVYAFCKLNGWAIVPTKKCHFMLRHPVAGLVVHSGTSGDQKSEMACITRMRRYMRQHNIEEKTK